MPQGTPMMQQYREIKEQHKDCILFYRLGDFYEMFNEDAQIASKELDLVLTSRDRSAPEEERVPMCGVPYHAAESYVARLISRGYKVAVCEQMEDPKLAKGLVKREIIRVITPGTAIDSSMLEETKNNFLAAVWTEEQGDGLCFCDLSTGELYATQLGAGGGENARTVQSELGRFAPAETLLNGAAAAIPGLREFLGERLGCAVERRDDDFFAEDAIGVCERQFGKTAAQLGLDEKPLAACAAAGLLRYLYETQKADLSHISAIDLYEQGRFMELDYAARRNLELCATLRAGEKKGSLLWVLDKTKTSMGGRLIRSWIEKPLMSPGEIDRRLGAVDELFRSMKLRDDVAAALTGVTDMERLLTRIVYGTAGARDLRSLAEAARRLPSLRAALAEVTASQLRELRAEVDELTDLVELIDRAIVDEPPFSIREGGFIRDGYSAEVDELREILSGGRGGVAGVEARERERTGIKTLKVGYNKVFGYYIEVRKSAGDQVPDDYIRKQTLADRERYITPELKEMESTILTASERLNALEGQLFEGLRAQISGETHRIQRTAHAVAQLDVLRSFAEVAAANGYCRPEVDLSDVIEIRDGRHPVVERMLTGGMFVPNDTLLDCGENRTAIITGPNMAGKSTYMRQVALITLMAQIGSFVPARSARIGVADRIFTRIGASDDLSAGRSTFMVEMSEVAEILAGATRRSLLILDEIGRGTSTFDGMAIARAVLEWVCDKKKVGARTLFATHYHELTALEQELGGVKNYNIAVKKRGRDIVFLRKIVRGGTDDSFGIEVARLAGLPEGLIRRADTLLQDLEANAVRPQFSGEAREQEPQISMLDLGSGEIAEELKKLDLNILTPIEAMNKLFELKQIADKL